MKAEHDEYDGWVIKAFTRGAIFLCTGLFGYTKRDAIKNFEQLFGKGSWAKKRRKGEFKLVKVKVTEVMEEVEE